MRCFLAVLPPPEVVEHLDDHLEARRLADTDRDWRWTRTAHLHLTLAFLADLPEWREEDLAAALDAWSARHRPLTMSFGQAGAFPEPGRAKVLWVGVTEPAAREELSAWAGQLRALATHHGADVDGQRFVPHVTAARSPRARAAGRWVQALDAYRSPSFTVTEVALVRSHLGQGPGRSPRYETLHEAVLGRPAPSRSTPAPG